MPLDLEAKAGRIQRDPQDGGDRFTEGVAYAVAHGLRWPSGEFSETLVELVLEAAQALLRDRLASDPDRARQMVVEALRTLNPADWVIVGVRSEDISGLREVLGPGVSVQAVEGLEAGECVIETDKEGLDGRLRIRVDALRRALSTLA